MASINILGNYVGALTHNALQLMRSHMYKGLDVQLVMSQLIADCVSPKVMTPTIHHLKNACVAVTNSVSAKKMKINIWDGYKIEDSVSQPHIPT